MRSSRTAPASNIGYVFFRWLEDTPSDWLVLQCEPAIRHVRVLVEKEI